MDERGFISKGYTTTMFSNICSSCFRRTTCVRASAMNLGDRQYLLSITHHKQKDVEGVMAFGRKFHEKIQTGIPELKDFEPLEFYGDIYSGRLVLLKEVPICSPSIGLRGHPDILLFKYYPRTKSLYIRIEEIKTGFKPSYILQLTTYAMILASPDALLHFDLEKGISYRLYATTDITISIHGIFRIRGRSGQTTEWRYWFIKDNIPTERFTTMSKAVLKKRKQLVRYHGPGLYDITQVKCAKDCPLLGGNRRCGYTDICSRYPMKKTRQLYLGKRKLLVKTKPKVKAAPPAKTVPKMVATPSGPTLDRWI